MTNKKYTAEGLPVVGKSILKVFGRDCIKDWRIYGIDPSEDDQSIFAEEIRKMANTQPELFSDLERKARNYFNEISDLAERYDISDILTIAYMTGALNCYAAIRKQAEANKLEEGFRKK